MNVLVLYRNSGKGGVATNTRSLVKGLRSRGINTVVAGSDGPGTRSILGDLDVKILDYSDRNPIHIYSNIAGIVRDNDIDLIHAQNRLPALYASLVCLLNRRIKYVWSNLQTPIPCDFFHRITTKYGERAITGSMEGYDFLTDKLRIPKNKVSVVNLGVDIGKFEQASFAERDRIRDKYHIGKSEIVILLYGRLAESKGHMFLLQALDGIKDLPAIRIVFPGDGDEKYKDELCSYARQIGIADKILFPGFADGKELLSMTDLMVLPSVQEGFAISCIEAFCMGVPVIRTKTGGYEDTKEFCTGVDYGDVETLKNELVSFFSGDEKYKRKASAALDARDRFSLDYMIDQYIKIYESVLNVDL